MAGVPFSPGIKFSQFAQGGMPVAGDQAAGLRNGIDTLFDIGASGPPSTLTLAVVQPAHGFTVGQVVRFTGAAFVLAQADNAGDAEVFGIVASVQDANDFMIQFGGIVTVLPAPVSPLIPGNIYFLSAAAAGAMTNVPPVAIGQIRKALMIAYTATSGLWLNYLGQQL